MCCSKRSALQASFRKWVNIETWQAPFAATLTLRQCITVWDGHQSVRVALTEQSASQNFRHFLNKLNRSVYGKAAQRFGKGVSVIPVLEGDADKRLHYHAIIDCPRAELIADLPVIVAEAWRSTQWGYHQTDIQAGADRGWLNYMTKLRDKPDFADSIDWMNFHLP
jgi:hypothetical protein